MNAINGYQKMWRPIVKSYLSQLANPEKRNAAMGELVEWIERMGVIDPKENPEDNKHVRKVTEILHAELNDPNIEGPDTWCTGFAGGCEQRVRHINPKTHRVTYKGFHNAERTKFPPIHMGRVFAEVETELSKWRQRCVHQ